MKREGRQHGLVRTHRIIPPPWNPRPESKVVNSLDSPPTSGLFTKVPTKPTNHSKFTGKCGKPRCSTCHLHPACKSKDKTKGTQKLSSLHMVSNYRLITWRLVNDAARPGLKFSGFSASGILDYIYDDDDDDYDEVEVEVDNYDAASYDQHHDDEESVEMGPSEAAHNRDRADESNDEGVMSFCEVGMVFDEDIEGEEDWCLVGEM